MKILTLKMPDGTGTEKTNASTKNPFYDGNEYSRFFVNCFADDMEAELKRICAAFGAYPGNYRLDLKSYGNGVYEVKALGYLYAGDYGPFSSIYRMFAMYANEVRRDAITGKGYYPVTVSFKLNMNAMRRTA